MSKAAKAGGGKVKVDGGRKKKAAAAPAAEAPAGPLILDRLWTTVMARRAADPAVSHSARLLSRGTAKVAQKFGEEAVECLIEAVAKNPNACRRARTCSIT